MGFETIAPKLSLIDTVALTLAKGQFWGVWTLVLRPYCAQLFGAIRDYLRARIAACRSVDFDRPLPRL